LEPAKELAQDQVEESECHGRTSSPAFHLAAKPPLNLRDDTFRHLQAQEALVSTLRGTGVD
jgi:hypothetical protein